MTSEEAIQIAKENAAAKGWTWLEPAKADFSRWRKRWTVKSNAGSIGVTVVTKIDDSTRGIVDAKFWKR